MRKMFLENLPRWKDGNCKGSINWKESIGCKIHFIYDEVEDILEIVDYIKGRNQKVKVLYNGTIYEVSCDRMRKCQIGNQLLNKRTSEFRIEIGQTFKDNKRDFIIIDREYKKDKDGVNRKYYKYHCNVCYWNEGWIEERNLKNGNGCSCCGNKTVVKGINDIATTNPELIKYFVNEEEGYNYTYSSNKKVLCKCPNCNYKKEMKICDLYYKGFSCHQCSDGISYPEKIMYNLLKQLKENKLIKDFIYQYSKTNSKWCSKYRYDFYFKLNNEQYIIETHGGQHYCNKTKFKRTLEEEQQNDKNKYNLAILNGIKPNNYIVIDCRLSNLDFIKNNIINSRLNEIFNLNNIDWIKIGQYSEKSLVKEICDYWYLHDNINNEGLTTDYVGYVFNTTRNTIINYLKKGMKLGWCNYDINKERIKGIRKASLSRSIPIKILKNGILKGIFISSSELEKQSEILFGTKLNNSKISSVCNGKRKTHKGYTFKRISKEEFNSLIDNSNDTYKLYNVL